MHKLIDFICDELEDLEDKVGKGEKLSLSEIQYMDTLAHAKKNLLKGEMLMDDYGYSGTAMMPEHSYARGRTGAVRRDSMGRYSKRSRYYMADGSDMITELKALMHEAPDEHTRMEFQKFIDKMERVR